MDNNIHLEVENLSRSFNYQMDYIERIFSKMGGRNKDSSLKAVDQVCFSMKKGEKLGLVGESGCGKSTIGKIIAGILPPTSGSFTINGIKNIDFYDHPDRIKVQMIMQDSMSALNRRKKVIDLLTEAPLYHKIFSPEEKEQRAVLLLEKMGLAANDLQKLPHMFSGGQRQRINIARSLAVNPSFLICDESVAALDVSIQAQILNLLLELQQELGLSMLFISHNLSVVHHFADNIIVMYLGRMVEYASAEELFAHAKHPYTRLLLETMPNLNQFNKNFKKIEGEVPSPYSIPMGCSFHPRCPNRKEICKQVNPEFKGGEHKVACHLYS